MKVLFLSPHTDDSELGAGGTIARLIKEGHDVYHYAFSCADKSVIQLGLEPGTLRKEIKMAMETLGVEKLGLGDFEVRTFSYHRQEILDIMLELKRDFEPDLVFCPSENDLHQDHQVIASEAIRMFKHCNILSYEMPWNNRNFRPEYFIELQAEHMDKKMKALDCYESQKRKPYIKHKILFFMGLAKIRGVQANVDFAEAFEQIRTIDKIKI